MLQDLIHLIFSLFIIIICSPLAGLNAYPYSTSSINNTNLLITTTGNNNQSELMFNSTKNGNSSQFENNNNNNNNINKTEHEFTRLNKHSLIEKKMKNEKNKLKIITELDSDDNGNHFENLTDQVKTATTVYNFVLNNNTLNELNITSDHDLLNNKESSISPETELNPIHFPFAENKTNYGILATISKQNNNFTEINFDHETRGSNESTFRTIVSPDATLYSETTTATQQTEILNVDNTTNDTGYSTESEKIEQILKSSSEISISDTTDDFPKTKEFTIEEISTGRTTFNTTTQFEGTISRETSTYTSSSPTIEIFESTKSDTTVVTSTNNATNDDEGTVKIIKTVVNIPLTNSSNSKDQEFQPIEKGELLVVAASIASVLVLGLLILLVYVLRTDKFNCRAIRDRTMSSVKPRPLSVKGFLRHCMELNETPARLASEFQLLASLTADLSRDDRLLIGRLPENRRRNRYINILPFDDTRVILHNKSTETSDYINASYIMGYSDRVEYIATQGPKEETCQHFWQMVFDERVAVIAMVTQFEEAGKEKCHNYFPKYHEQMSWDDESLIVYCVTEAEFPVYTSRTLHVYKDNAKRVVTHLHFREWADFKVPETTDSMIEFCQAARQHLARLDNNTGLILTHCSAGVGRTGTLITVDILLQAVADGKKIDVFGTVFRLRHERMMMVQTDAQYAYIYKCIENSLLDGKCVNHVKTSYSESVYENIQMNIINEGQSSTKVYNNQVNEYDDCNVIVNDDVDECTRILLPKNNQNKNRSRFFITLNKLLIKKP